MKNNSFKNNHYSLQKWSLVWQLRKAKKKVFQECCLTQITAPMWQTKFSVIDKHCLQNYGKLAFESTAHNPIKLFCNFTLKASPFETNKNSFRTECVRNFDWVLVKVGRWLVLSHFWPLLMRATIFGGCSIITCNRLQPKTKHYSQVKDEQIPDTHGIIKLCNSS